MDTKEIVLLGAAGAGLYVLFKGMKQFQKGTDYVAEGIAKLYLKMTLAPPVQVLGNVLFPNGTKVPLSQLEIRTDSAHDVFTRFQGNIYQLQPSNAQGDWPATLRT